MRFDVNISVSKEEGKLGRRAEIKNLNSFRSVENAVKYEIDRQIELLEKGGTIAQETRGWDEAKQKTTSQRGKEEAHDYRYMPEPDIPPLELANEFIEKIKNEMPEMPSDWRNILNKLSIPPAAIELLLERNGEYGLNYLERVREGIKISDKVGVFVAKYIVNDYFNITDEIKKMTEGADPAAAYLPTIKQITDVYEMVEQNKLSSTSAKMLLYNAWTSPPNTNLIELAGKLNLLQVSDEAEIDKIVAEVLEQNPQVAADIKNGEMKAIGFLVGQVMAKSRGQANPQIAQELIRKHLGL